MYDEFSETNIKDETKNKIDTFIQFHLKVSVPTLDCPLHP